MFSTSDDTQLNHDRHPSLIKLFVFGISDTVGRLIFAVKWLNWWHFVGVKSCVVVFV